MSLCVAHLLDLSLWVVEIVCQTALIIFTVHVQRWMHWMHSFNKYKFVKRMSYAALSLVTPESKQEPILYLTSTQEKLMFLFPQAASWF